MRTRKQRFHPAPGWLAALFMLVGLCGCNSMAGRYNNQVGMMHYQRGNFAAAQAEFFRAYADAPRNADYSSNLAAAMRKQGDIAGSEQLYRQALNIDSSHQPSYHGLAQLMVEQNRHGEATALLQTWSTAHPYHPAPHIETAWLKRQTGDIAGAENSLQQALQLRPNHPAALAQLGDLYQQTGRQDLAVAMYQRSLQSKWSQPAVQTRLASLTRPSRMRGAYPQLAFASPPPGMAYGTSPTLAAIPDPVSYQSANLPIPNADPAHSDMDASLDDASSGPL
jgi:Tfp pilus assembly protein PilF